MATYRFGDVVYAPLGYADDVTVADDRPAVVISSQAFNDARRDVVLMEITTRLHQAKRYGAVEVVDWPRSGLRYASVIKPIVFTVLQTDIISTWGHLDPQTERNLRAILPKIFGP
jgi:mRNA-degrading endonuclease toxin of MazEF toxin-antitoxin module